MAIDPLMKPDPPIPEIARPAISMLELVAAPATMDPIEKTQRNVRNVVLWL